MEWEALLSIAIVVIGAVIGVIKREKIKDAAEITKAGVEAVTSAISSSDDTPGRITPAEVGEITEAIGKKAKEVLRDM